MYQKYANKGNGLFYAKWHFSGKKFEEVLVCTFTCLTYMVCIHFGSITKFVLFVLQILLLLSVFLDFLDFPIVTKVCTF